MNNTDIKPSPNRKRPIRVTFRISEEERQIIRAKMKLCGSTNMNAFLRKAAIYDKVIVYDFETIKKTNNELNKIGVNINQLVARVNSTGNVYQEDLIYLKESVEKIWQLQKSILSNLL